MYAINASTVLLKPLSDAPWRPRRRSAGLKICSIVVPLRVHNLELCPVVDHGRTAT